MGAPINASASTVSACELTITDNDNPPTVSFSPESGNVPENAGDIVLVIRLSAPSSFEITVTYTTGGNASDSEGFGIPVGPGRLGSGRDNQPENRQNLSNYRHFQEPYHIHIAFFNIKKRGMGLCGIGVGRTH